MGFFQRMKLLVSSNVNHAISKAEDPEKMLDQIICEMTKQLQEAKKDVAVAIADEKRLERQLQAEQEKVKEWHDKAVLAVRNGKDDLAREALKRKGEHESVAAEYQKQWQHQHAATEQLRGQLRQLNDKIEEASRKKNMLKARAKRAKAQQKIHDTMSGLSDTSAFEHFDRMVAKVDQMEAEADASLELSNDLGGRDLDQQFAELKSGGGMDTELAALKASLDAPAASAPADDDALAALKKDLG